MSKNINKYLYWIPRILAIVFILFLSIFSLDVFEPGLNAWQIIIGLLIHNIPVFILAIVLWISWKREIVGGIFFILAGILLSTVSVVRMVQSEYFTWYGTLGVALTVGGPAIIIGILFLIGWFKKIKLTINI
jgi:hypothetical protein